MSFVASRFVGIAYLMWDAALMILVPGSHLGPFEIIALIAKGGMGEVYRALDPRLGREVAIKVSEASLANALSVRRARSPR